jgi:hypothetical protein
MKRSIVVAAYRSEMGKTTFVCRFLRKFPDWAGVKIITYHIHKMPKEIAEKGYDIITDPKILSEAGTDTGRMWEIIHHNTFWVRTKPEKLPEALDSLFLKLQKFDSVIFEGTSILLHHHPNTSVMLIDDKDKKPSARKIMDKIDVFLPAINFFHHDCPNPLSEKFRDRFFDINWNNDENFDKVVNVLGIT